jgi:hypothetical protein
MSAFGPERIFHFYRPRRVGAAEVEEPRFDRITPVPSEANCRQQKRQRVRHPVLKKRGGAADVACDDPADVLKTDTQLAGSRSAHKNLEESLDFFLRRRWLADQRACFAPTFERLPLLS